jgi:hypothetical protein
VYLASDNGILLCLRDKASKYAAPQRIAPATHKKYIDESKPVLAGGPATATPPAEAPAAKN